MQCTNILEHLTLTVTVYNSVVKVEWCVLYPIHISFVAVVFFVVFLACHQAMILMKQCQEVP